MMLRNFDIKRVGASAAARGIDKVAVEEPLAIRVQHWRKSASLTENLAVTMRTPGADQQLALGLLLTEGVITQRSDVVDVRALGTEPSNEILVELAPHVDFEAWRQQRNGFVSSSCGVCGKASADQIRQALPAAEPTNWRITPEFINALPGLLHDHQIAFQATGGVHAAALVSLDGELMVLFEDIGRHNALDKVIGHATLTDQLPLRRQVLFLSSRSSFELIQKAAMAGAQMLASVGSPSSLAIETARQVGLTLICFVRDRRFNVYSGDWRLDL
jgi:FdhD protein